ncbi:MAG: hypothetical protein ACE5IR_17910 [bacterium]
MKKILMNSLIGFLLFGFANSSSPQTVSPGQDERSTQVSSATHGKATDAAKAAELRANYRPKIVRSNIAIPENLNLEALGTQQTAIDNKGKDFWLCFQQSFDDAELSLKFFITSDVATNATITIPAISWEE